MVEKIKMRINKTTNQSWEKTVIRTRKARDEGDSNDGSSKVKVMDAHDSTCSAVEMSLKTVRKRTVKYNPDRD